MITAGPTREWMDPVRYLSNPSSGALGIELAKALRAKRIGVVLILGPTSLEPPKSLKTIRVQTAVEMWAAVKKKWPRCDAFVSTAAVGDWRFARVARRKIKKTGSDRMTVTLVKNPDILAWAGRTKTDAQRVIGFALETDRSRANALKKMRAKNLDLIVANRPDSFGSETIRPLWIERDGRARALPRMTKARLSTRIADWLNEKWNESNSKN